MGVTIHFQGRLKSNEDYKQVLTIAKRFAEDNKMPFSIFEAVDKLLLRVKDGKDWNYQGKTRGIRIQPSENSEPLFLEFDEDNYIQEYCKTQFADVSIHMKIVSLLRTIEPYFEEIIVDDEGEFWETDDVALLQKHIDNCFERMKIAKMENGKLSGPYREADGRIVDLMG